jgi:hypothetical protein
VIVAILVVLAAACDSAGQPPKPSRSTGAPGSATIPVSPSPTRTGPLSTGPNVRPGELPPVLSADAKQHTSSGALLFAGYYFKAYDWGIATTDPYLVQQISAPSCGACKRYIDGLNSLRRENGYVKGGRIDVQSSHLTSGSFRFKSDYVVAVAVVEAALVEVRPSAAPSTTAPGTTHDTSLVFVSWAGHSWKIVEVGAPS